VDGFQIKDEYYNNTLFDGELIMNKNGDWVFYIHDCISYQGENVSKQKYFNRLHYAHEFVENTEYTDSPFSIKNKPILNFTESGLKTILETEFDHNTDGLVFTPVILPVHSGTQYSMFKYKDVSKHSFDFKITVKENKICVYMTDKSELKLFMKGNTEDADVLEFYEELKNLDNWSDDCLVECSYDLEKDKYTPLLVRTDKVHPNGQTTIQRTFVNIKENINVEDLFSIVC